MFPIDIRYNGDSAEVAGFWSQVVQDLNASTYTFEKVTSLRLIFLTCKMSIMIPHSRMLLEIKYPWQIEGTQSIFKETRLIKTVNDTNKWSINSQTYAMPAERPVGWKSDF